MQLNTTPWRVRRIGEAFRDGGMDAAKTLKWGAGRPLKQMNFAEGEIEEMVSVPMLYQLAGMSLQARAEQISHQLDKDLKASELRKLYAGRGITKQVVRPSFSGGQSLPEMEQVSALQGLATEVGWYLEQGYEIVQIDECTFGPNQYCNKQWAR